jgi:hypothetical protein
LEGLTITNVGTFYGPLEYFVSHLVYFRPFGNIVVIWYIFPILVHCIKKNMATLPGDSGVAQFNSVLIKEHEMVLQGDQIGRIFAY